MPETLEFTEELQRTSPDYVVYVPKSFDGSTYDTGNEHFLVFDGPDGSLMAIWTQSTRECLPNQRIVFSRSVDEGRTWTVPQLIAGPKPPAEGNIASWAFPMVSKTGRIYVLYNQHIGVNDLFLHTTGLMAGIYSDDLGRSWSGSEAIPMKRSQWDNPDPAIPANWIVWQKPLRLSEGKYFTGFTRWVSKEVRHTPPIDSWIAAESVVEFMRFENIDENPQVSDIEVSYFASDDEAIRVGYPGHPEVSVTQEPSLVSLPDGRLFCMMRTAAGHPYYVVSEDHGKSWSSSEVLRYRDDGEAILHPLSPCPIYPLSDGRYVFLFHNNDGHFEGWGPTDTIQNRRPIYMALGEYRAGARQPIWFSQPKFLMDDDGISLGYADGRCDLAMYASFTNRQGRDVLWYPERKFFLLGRDIDQDLISDLKAFIGAITMDVLSVDEVKAALHFEGPVRAPLAMSLWHNHETVFDREDEWAAIEKSFPDDCLHYAIGPNYWEGPADDPSYRWAFGDKQKASELPIDACPIIDNWDELESFLEELPAANRVEVFGPLKELRKANPNRYILVSFGHYFHQRLAYLRGIENLLLDFYDHQQELRQVMDALLGLYSLWAEWISEAGANGVWAGDDLGTQRSLFMRPETFRSIYKPYYHELAAIFHRCGLDFWLHTCGHIRPIIGDIIEAGVDALHPIQVGTMDDREVMTEYGGKIAFWLGMDVQQVIPFGTVEQVRRHVRERIDTFYRPDGGLILAAGNAIMRDTPTENIIAYAEELRRPVR